MRHGGFLPDDEPHEMVQERFWEEYYGAVEHGARMTPLPPRYFRRGRIGWWQARRLAKRGFGRPMIGRSRHTAMKAALASHCAGLDGGLPDPKEMLAAMRAAQPDARQAYLVRMWVNEIPTGWVMAAWHEGSYSWRDVAGGARRAGAGKCYQGLLINRHRMVDMLRDTRRDWSPERIAEVQARALEGMRTGW